MELLVVAAARAVEAAGVRLCRLPAGALGDKRNELAKMISMAPEQMKAVTISRHAMILQRVAMGRKECRQCGGRMQRTGQDAEDGAAAMKSEEQAGKKMRALRAQMRT